MPRNDYDRLLEEIHRRRRSIELSMSVLVDKYGLEDCSPATIAKYLKELEAKRDAIRKRIKKAIDSIERDFASTLDELDAD